MNYSEMSYFEINVAIAKKRGWKVKTKFEKFGFTEEYHREYPNTVWIGKCDESGDQIEPWEQFNFDEWSDIGPIIMENYISIELRKGKHCDLDHLASIDGDAPYPDKNPKRAAAIVFLMIGVK